MLNNHAMVRLAQRLNNYSEKESIQVFGDALKEVWVDPTYCDERRVRLWSKEQGLILAGSIFQDAIHVATIYPEEQFIGIIRENNYQTTRDLSKNKILYLGKEYENAQDFKARAFQNQQTTLIKQSQC